MREDFPEEDHLDGKGIVLLDVLLVSIIIAILGMIVVPRVSSLITDTRLNGAAGEITGGLNYALNLAVRYQRPFGVKGDVTGNWFRVYDSDPKPNSVPPARPDNDPPVDANGVVLNPFDKTWYVRDFDTLDAYRGVKIVSIPAGGTVQFYPDGHSGSGDSTFAVSCGGKQTTITVNGANGRVTVQ
jgi:Tfp pilus assembly protein FimT